jgi:hypothetical protein
MTCKHENSRVLATRTDDIGVKVRTRLCGACNFRLKTWEIPQGLVHPRDITALIRKAAGAANLKPSAHMLDAERVDLVLAALDAGETHASIAGRLKISSKTIQRVKRGAR